MTIGPVSLFDSVTSNQPSDCAYLSFEDFTEIMSAYSKDTFASKSDAPLICLTEFKGGRRKKANAQHSGMLVLDIDDHLNISDVNTVLEEEGLAALLCSTASHRAAKHKFRVFIPLAEVASYNDHSLAWHVANQAVADGKADASKVGAESMFFVPGVYPDAPIVFQTYEGVRLSASDWIGLVGSREDVQALAGIKSAPNFKPRGATAFKQRTASNADLDLSRTRLVTDRSLEEYRNPSGAYHHARFRLLMSMSGRARRLGVAINASDLVLLFNQVDLEDGGFYQHPDYQAAIKAEADKVIATQ